MIPEAPSRRTLSGWVCVLLAAALPFAGIGCGSGGGIGQSSDAQLLPEYNPQGQYDPYYATSEMNISRYLHVAFLLQIGLVVAVGGSDENGLSSIDSIELFDQSTLKADEVEPESGLGTWFDTDFEGNPITLNSGGRIYHTVSELPDDRVIIIGGTANLALAREIDTAEIFDPLTRTLEELEEKMVTPRFRHAAHLIPSGRIMIVGGQIFSQFTVNDTVNVQGGGNFATGQVNLQQRVDSFPSIKTNEFYDISELAFFPLTVLETTRDAELTTRRGRSGHAIERFAGPDNRLDSNDDLFLIVGGFQTLSGQNAPQSKFPGLTGIGGQTALTNIEFYDPQVGVFTKLPAIGLLGARINTPQPVNLGRFNEFTWDGVQGMGNVVLVCNGDNDAPIGARETVPEDEVLMATYTGFGPAQGLQMFRQRSNNQAHWQGTEWAASFDPGLLPPDPILGYELSGLAGGPSPGRTNTTAVAVARQLPDLGGFVETAVYNCAGVALGWIPPQVFWLEGTIAAGVIFDPFFSLDAAIDFQLSPRDLSPGRLDPRNPTGVVGAWLLLDEEIPTNQPLQPSISDPTQQILPGFGTTPPGGWAEITAPHTWCANTTIGGPDGIDGTIDDRILITGGGVDFAAPGGDPTSPSTEILIQPGQGSDLLGISE